MDLKELGTFSGSPADHWYYASKLEAMLAATGGCREVMDVGAGSGFFSRAMLERRAALSATCVDPGYERDEDVDVGGLTMSFRRSVEASGADLVLMMDVLEHVPDDAGLVAEYVGKVRPGTRFLVTVPAFRWLWSGHDTYLGHYRRYTLGQLERTLRDGGLDLERSNYIYGAVFPLAAASRLAARLTSRGKEPRSAMGAFPRPVDAVLRAACKAELAVSRFNRVAGLSVMALARKPG